MTFLGWNYWPTLLRNMQAKFSRFAERVDALLAKQGGKSLNRWMDNQEVCRQLNISPRTLQTLRDNGTLAYSQINHKVFYKPEGRKNGTLRHLDISTIN